MLPGGGFVSPYWYPNDPGSTDSFVAGAGSSGALGFLNSNGPISDAGLDNIDGYLVNMGTGKSNDTDGDGEPNPPSNSEPTIDPSDKETQDMLNELLGSADNPKDALSVLRDLSAQDPKWMELYLQLLSERENNADAWKRYEEFNNSYYQRSTKDLEAAGMNPWLALQSLGSSGTGSIAQAGTFNPSVNTSKATEKGTSMSMTSNITKGILSFFGVVIGALIYAML